MVQSVRIAPSCKTHRTYTCLLDSLLEHPQQRDQLLRSHKPLGPSIHQGLGRNKKRSKKSINKDASRTENVRHLPREIERKREREAQRHRGTEAPMEMADKHI